MTKYKLNIREKNFFYNLILSLLICIIIFAYMIFYMPKVYMEKKMATTEANAKRVHQSFVQHKSYDFLEEGSKEAMYSIFKPRAKAEIYGSSLHANFNGQIKNENIIELFSYIENVDLEDFDKTELLDHLKLIFKDLGANSEDFINLNYRLKEDSGADQDISIKTLGSIVQVKIESRTKDSLAANLILFSRNSEGTFILFYPFIFNSINDIKATIIPALPLIFLLVLIIVFMLNRFYSKTITEPIIKMTKFTKRSKYYTNAVYDLDISNKDEIGELSNNLKDLYETLTDNYKKLEKSAKQREIFIKSSSHELKTPLQTAILLNESMMNKIGKYANTEKYLPELRNHLYKLQVLIEDLLYMNKIGQEPNFEDLDLALIAKESINKHRDLIEEKNLKLQVEGTKLDKIDYDYFRIVFDNLIKNSIENTESSGNILCSFGEKIIFTNWPTSIDEDKLDLIFEPFVSGKKEKSNGMGLYISKVLLEEMAYNINISFKDQVFTLEMEKERKKSSGQ